MVEVYRPLKNARADGVVVRAVLDEARVRGVARPGRAVGVLVLLDVDEVAVQVRDQDRQRRAVGVVLVAGVLDGVGGVEARVDDRQVRLLARAGQLIGPGLAQQQVAVDLLLGQQHPRRHALEHAGETFLVRAAGDGDLETSVRYDIQTRGTSCKKGPRNRLPIRLPALVEEDSRFASKSWI